MSNIYIEISSDLGQDLTAKTAIAKIFRAGHAFVSHDCDAR